MNVLSLFDGMSCGQITLNELGIKVDNYYASEIDKHAIKVTRHNFPETIQIGDVTKVSVKDLPKIDLVLAGSPCQGFSFAGKQLAFDDPRSALFFEFLRIWNEVKEKNPNAKVLLENVRMKKEHEYVISRYMGVAPLEINSALVSAQNRFRLYWTNIYNEPYGLFGDMQCMIPQPEDKGILLKDILESEADERYYLSDRGLRGMLAHKNNHQDKRNGFGVQFINEKTEKSNTILGRCFKDCKDNAFLSNHSDMDLTVHNTMPRSSKTGKGGTGHLSRSDGKTYCLDTGQTNAIEIGNNRIRRLTPTECKRLQTVPEFYDMSIVSDTQQYRMLGNGWTIEVIKHILSYL